ncbi:hypothetical protein [Pseudophaeobacter sp.]
MPDVLHPFHGISRDEAEAKIDEVEKGKCEQYQPAYDAGAGDPVALP